jgi:hypothetical protein
MDSLLKQPEGEEHFGHVVHLLQQVSNGDEAAVGNLLPLVYDQLRALAQQRMLQERPGHTLQATALVHEAFLKLVGPRGRGKLIFTPRRLRPCAGFWSTMPVDESGRNVAGRGSESS